MNEIARPRRAAAAAHAFPPVHGMCPRGAAACAPHGRRGMGPHLSQEHGRNCHGHGRAAATRRPFFLCHCLAVCRRWAGDAYRCIERAPREQNRRRRLLHEAKILHDVGVTLIRTNKFQDSSSVKARARHRRLLDSTGGARRYGAREREQHTCGYSPCTLLEASRHRQRPPLGVCPTGRPPFS